MKRHTHGRQAEETAQEGALIRQARRYEFISWVGTLGRRRHVYDGLLALSGARPGDRVLDIGCGTGYLARRAARAVGPEGRVLGIDPSQPMIDYATARAPANSTFEVASAQALPHADASFDVVVSTLALHHVPQDEWPTALREARRVLRPGGRLLLADLRRQPRHTRLIRHGHSMALADDPRGLVEQAGFRVTGTGDRWPSLHYVQAETPAAGS